MLTLKAPVAIILAAGQSSRMGTCKASLPWGEGHTLLTYQVEQFQLAGFQTIVVVGPHNIDRCQADLAKRSLSPLVVLNPEPHRGKTSSILLGLQWVDADCPGIVISSVDQPRPVWVYRQLWQTHQANPSPITAPAYAGQLGHPLLFSSQLRCHLQAIQEESLGLRQVVQQFKSDLQRVEFEREIVLKDLNTPEAYQTAFEQGKNLADF